ncbi:Pentatricopeptide repeat-containing protein [Forsythia ovata]|uniref:Pentatricopeptide repeat-containing protein n=1 Tax=Forsythia ovata TaxID=205694 RepID=A0ABD1WS90_9LAMI
MASISGIAAINNLRLTRGSSSRHYNFLATPKPNKPTQRNMFWNFRLVKSVELDMFVTGDDEDEMSERFFQAIEELERMTRVSQEGRDFCCTVEVFKCLQKDNRVGKEKMKLMVSIMCSCMQRGTTKKI